MFNSESESAASPESRSRNSKQTAFYIAAAGLLIIALISGLVLWANRSRSGDLEKLKLRLEWYPQSQFAGFIVAKQKGFYREEGLDVELQPAGPDLKPQVTVAAGIDDLGIGVPNQIITARSNGVPLVGIAQLFQDSANRYVLKDKNKISDLRELRGKKVGLWLGGDEVEFVAMLATVGMTLRDVQVIPQGFSVIPFLQDQYDVSQVTTYNELNQIHGQGYEGDKLQVLSPRDYNAAILGDVVFTRESTLHTKHAAIVRFLTASFRGWQYCIDHPNEALDIVLEYNPELQREDQQSQLHEVLSLLTAGSAQSHGLGYMNLPDYQNAERILFESGQINTHVDAAKAIDLGAWSAVPGLAKVNGSVTHGSPVP